jgi:hypothetical protein
MPLVQTLPHIDRQFRSAHNDKAMALLLERKAAEHERIGFTNPKFYTFMGLFTNHSNQYNYQMACFWRWLKGQQGVKREYTYDYMFSSTTEVLILVGVESINGELFLVQKTKTGKKEWSEPIIGSCFFKHWERKNINAGKFIST